MWICCRHSTHASSLFLTTIYCMSDYMYSSSYGRIDMRERLPPPPVAHRVTHITYVITYVHDEYIWTQVFPQRILEQILALRVQKYKYWGSHFCSFNLRQLRGLCVFIRPWSQRAWHRHLVVSQSAIVKHVFQSPRCTQTSPQPPQVCLDNIHTHTHTNTHNTYRAVQRAYVNIRQHTSSYTSIHQYTYFVVHRNYFLTQGEIVRSMREREWEREGFRIEWLYISWPSFLLFPDLDVTLPLKIYCGPCPY